MSHDNQWYKKIANTLSRKEIVKPETPAQEQVDTTVFGYVERRGELVPFGIPKKDNQNTFIFGEIKSGKTTLLKTLIAQDVKDGTGFFLLDPHRQCAMDILAMIPPEQRNRIVYISLGSPIAFDGYCIRINPLECENPDEKYIAVSSFMSMLSQHYGKFWGPKLETLIRNMVNVLIHIPDSKFTDMIKILTDKKVREYMLTFCPYENTVSFFQHIYESSYESETAGSAYNKIDKIVSIPTVLMMLDATKSSITVERMIKENKIVIMDLLSGATPEIAEFMGAVILHMFNVEGKRRQEKGINQDAQFNIYVDEAHMFSSAVLRELLNTVRKFGMRLTLATQTIDKLNEDLADEVLALCQTVVSFRCNYNTAKMLADSLPLDTRKITTLSNHMFALWSKSDPPVQGIGITKPMPSFSYEQVRHIMRESLERYGDKVNLSTYMPVNASAKNGPKLSPLEFFLLNTLYLEGRDMTWGELSQAAHCTFEVTPREINAALFDTLVSHNRYVIANKPKMDDGDSSINLRFSISKLAISSIYSKAVAGRRAGGQLHVGTIFAMMDSQLRNHNYCVIDRGDKNEEMADMLVYSFLPIHENNKITHDSAGNQAPGLFTMYNPKKWSHDVIAVEVETDTTKHESQVYRNYVKNKKNNHDVCFVVFSDKIAIHITDVLAKNGIGVEQYQIMVFPQGITQEQERQGQDVLLSESEAAIIRELEHTDGATTRRIIKTASLAPLEVFAALQSLERKKILEKSGIGHKGSKKTTWIKKDEMVQKSEPKDDKVQEPKPQIQTQPTKYATSETNALLFLINEGSEDPDVFEELRRRNYGICPKKKGAGFSIHKLSKNSKK
ncbi:MAG: type IV secretion system DNA-binding domain-containing protein [Thaumarchaeota archaeon]|nr:type IV secretion system DNA-binding domain-containing protein [Nitrososphaerota archaeon]